MLAFFIFLLHAMIIDAMFEGVRNFRVKSFLR